ncbi:MAG: TonB-dependent receptor [Flavobacteriaceae bacterium]|jgi:iron complex outermembrane receptor protein|nr:TonB-dependent receptor [Flavobacteriaceae bacterium]
MKKISIYILLNFSLLCFSQTIDSVKHKDIEDVIVIGKKALDYSKQPKPLSSLDEYLENSGKIEMIKRGNYAWEAALNSMTTERISVTIDGMKIFNACTDRMDPVTSYVEISNLKNLQINSGLQSGAHGGNSIGGGIDMNLNKMGFRPRTWKTGVSTGYESNGNASINGAEAARSTPKFYTNMGVFHRKSENYEAGGHEKIRHSQFEKWNAYANFGYQFSNSRIVESSLIYDNASNIGYPALTMDVKTARALIASLSYRKEKISRIFSDWETKIYFNTILHEMDDTHRPETLIHMDMPGESRTYGFYSKLKGKTTKHSFTVNWDGFYNQSQASMTMYPENSNEKPMFMYTWGDIKTFNSGLFFDDEYHFNDQNSVHFSTHLNFQNDGVENDDAFNSLKIFFPNMQKSQNRFLYNVSAKYHFHRKDWELILGGGYGERAPSVSESYGFYLFNSFDNYDYIGNPMLGNEKSLEADFSFKLNKNQLRINFDASYFYFFDYIIGKMTDFSPMTLGADGVKMYTAMDYASIFNAGLQMKYHFLPEFEWTNAVSYSLGRDSENRPLPLIAPVTYSSSLLFQKNNFSSEIQLKGAGKHSDFAPEFGEIQTSDYLIYNFSLGCNLSFARYELSLKAGVENLFDKRYTTYSDWNHILRKGRSFFVNVMFTL